MTYSSLLKTLLILYIFIILLYNYYFENKILFIEKDNQLYLYEENINFTNFSTDIKAIALYLPQFYRTKENDMWWGKGFTEWTNVKKSKPHFKGHHQPRKPGDKKNYLNYYNLTSSTIFKKQIELAKNHGIYGFAIYYYWLSGRRLLEKPMDIFLNDKNLNFPFMLIWANHNWTRKWDGRENEILLVQEYKDEDPKLFIKDIKKYIIDYRYIKINNKPVIGIYEPFQIPKINETINIWRKKSKEYGIGEIFVLICVTDNQIKPIQNLTLFDAAYDFPPRNLFESIPNKLKDTLLYTDLLYKNIQINDIINTKKIPIFRGSMLEWDNTPRISTGRIFDNYSPEQFYMLNKIIVEWTSKNYNKDNKFIFINAWNEWGEGSYLEPDERYGYASINSLSKALFNLSYVKTNNLIKLNITSKILVQAHIYDENLTEDIIKFTNNIPIKFDLFISLSCQILSKEIENYIKKNTKALNIQIKKFPYEKNDAIPFLEQVMNDIKRYKYCCHIYTKKSIHINFGAEWRDYLLNNLLGNSNIISDIITEFENNDCLGFIIPETYYKIFPKNENYNIGLYTKLMNSFLKEIFPNVKILIDNFDLPEWNNMFWAKTNAIHQIFDKNIVEKIKKKNKILGNIIQHCIERIWFYIVKLNGYYYKKVFKHI